MLYALRTKKRSESDPRSYEAQKTFWGSNGIRTHDLRDTSAMLYQLSYEASLEADQERVSIYTRYMKRVKWCLYDINHTYIFTADKE